MAGGGRGVTWWVYRWILRLVGPLLKTPLHLYMKSPREQLTDQENVLKDRLRGCSYRQHCRSRGSVNLYTRSSWRLNICSVWTWLQ